MFRNFFLTAIIFVLSVAIFISTVYNLDPFGQQKLVALFAFFLSLFFGVGAFFTFVFFFSAEIVLGRKLNSKAYLIALRRGILFSVFVVAILLLQFFRLLGLVEVVLLAVFLSLLEFIFLSSKK